MPKTTKPQINFAEWELLQQGILLEPLLQSISDFLDDQEETIEAVRCDLHRGLKNPETGRRGLTPSQVLRSLILMRVKNWDYRELHANASPIRWSARLLFFAIFIATFAVAPAAVTQQDSDARARDIVRQMTLDEKIMELHGIRDATHYRYVLPIPRLGIPALRITNGPAGVGPDGAGKQAPATALPSPISLAATWDTSAARQYGEVEGSEAKALGDDLLEAPTINIARVPQNGRTFEGCGEDPFLSGQMAVSNIEGIQSQGEIANVKHYVANNQETDRFVVNEVIGERALHEIYFPAFEAALREGHSAAVMCAYPKINGTYNCENDPLINQTLKKDWGFEGFVTSDFGAVHSTVPSANAGLDLELPAGKYFNDDLKAAVQSGQVPIATIDDKLVRRFRIMIRFGLFDHPPLPGVIPKEKDGAIALRLAEEGIVLLKNSHNILPLNAARLKSLAIIGPYAAKAVTGGGGSSHVVPLYSIDPVEGIRNRAGKNVRVDFADGIDAAQAVALARHADVAVVMVGQMNTEGRDHSISLDGNQDELIQAVAAANRRTIIVIQSGSAVLMPWTHKVSAILEAWYPGEEDGNAVAAILFGDVNPSGKLPLTFPRNVSDTFANNPEQYPGINKEVKYSEGVFIGYRNYDAKGIVPLFPFGYGLSYTKFAYKNLRISPGTFSFAADQNQKINVEFDITNIGQVAGAEVAELYVGMPSTNTVPQPPKQLKAFEKLPLKPGETRHAHMALNARSFSYWDSATHAWAVAPGAYRILVGSSSRDIRLRGVLQIKPIFQRLPNGY